MTERQQRLAIEKAERQRARLLAEEERTGKLYAHEDTLKDRGRICGIDEGGRGPLAGPVVTCAVILPDDHRILWLNDSKKLSEKKRETLYGTIMEEAVSVSLGSREAEEIDEINILQATLEAMYDAVKGLDPAPDMLLVDAVRVPHTEIPQLSIIHGDALSASIAAASIVAKVTRDRLMQEYHLRFPEYNFASNKGYGTAEHIEALKKYGPCPIHRRSFIGRILGE